MGRQAVSRKGRASGYQENAVETGRARGAPSPSASPHPARGSPGGVRQHRSEQLWGCFHGRENYLGPEAQTPDSQNYCPSAPEMSVRWAACEGALGAVLHGVCAQESGGAHEGGAPPLLPLRQRGPAVRLRRAGCWGSAPATSRTHLVFLLPGDSSRMDWRSRNDSRDSNMLRSLSASSRFRLGAASAEGEGPSLLG